jgi:hypothetical protein
VADSVTIYRQQNRTLSPRVSDSVLLRYARIPGDLPTHCDGCDQKFSVHHALDCKKGGLVISRHNEIRDELIDLASKALTPSAVCDKPRIHTSRTAESVRTSDQNPVIRNLHKRQGGERGDVLIRGLWQQGTDAIIDVCITNLDAKSNISRAPMKVLVAAHEREKKRKYLEPCLKQRCHFSTFVVSTDGLIGKEAQTMLKKLSARLAEKSGKPYSVVCGYVNACMSIAIVRATQPSMLARLQSANQPDEQSPSAMGRWRRLRPILSLDKKQAHEYVNEYPVDHTFALHITLSSTLVMPRCQCTFLILWLSY